MSQDTAKLSMIMAVKEDCGKIGGPQECAGCGKKIHDKYLLKVQRFVKNIILWGCGGWLGLIPLSSSSPAQCNVKLTSASQPARLQTVGI